MSVSRRRHEHAPDPEYARRSNRRSGRPSPGAAAPSLGDFLSQNRADDSDEPTGSGEDDTDDDDATFFSMFQWSKSGDASPAAPAGNKKLLSSSRSVGGRSMGGAQPLTSRQPLSRGLVRGSASVADVSMGRASPFIAPGTINRNQGYLGLYAKSRNDDDDDEDNGNAVGTTKPILRRSATSSLLGNTRGWMSSPEDDDEDFAAAAVLQQQSFRRRPSQKQLSKNDFLEKEASEKFDRFLRERDEKLAAERQRSSQTSSSCRPLGSSSRSGPRRSSIDDISRSDDRDRERRHRDGIADTDGDEGDDQDRDRKKKKKKKDRSSRKSSDGVERRERKDRDDKCERRERRHRGEGEERSERKDRGDKGDRERQRSSQRASGTDCEEKLRSASRRLSSRRLKETSSEADGEERLRSASRSRSSYRSKETSSEADGEERLRSASRRQSTYSYGSKETSSEADGEDKLLLANRRRSSHSFGSKETSSDGEEKLRSASRRRSSHSNVSKETLDDVEDKLRSASRKSSSRKHSSRRRTDENGDEAPRRSGRSDVSGEGRVRDSRRCSRSDADSQFESSYGTPSEVEELSKSKDAEDDVITILQFDPTKTGNIDQVITRRGSSVEIDLPDGTKSYGHIREMPMTPDGEYHVFSDSMTASLTTSLESSTQSSADRGIRRMVSTGGGMFRRLSKTGAPDVVHSRSRSVCRRRCLSEDGDSFNVPHLTVPALCETPSPRRPRLTEKDVDRHVRAKSTGRVESSRRSSRKRDSSRVKGYVR